MGACILPDAAKPKTHLVPQLLMKVTPLQFFTACCQLKTCAYLRMGCNSLLYFFNVEEILYSGKHTNKARS